MAFTTIPKEKKKMIIDNYHKLDNFLHQCHGVAKVNYIGQLASNPISFKRQPNDTENLCYSKIFDKDFNFRKVSTIFDECKEYIRNWYVSNDFYKNLLNRNYALNESRNQIYISNRIEGQFADIFPAQKVVMMLFFLCLAPYITFDESFQINELNPDDDNQDDIDKLIIELSNNIEYLNMIASYMLFVHLFNSFCGCRMEGKWNRNISNSYVYIYTQINEGESLMNDYKMNLLEEQQILNHIDKLNLSSEIKKMHEFRALIYFLKEISKDDIELMNMFGVGEINNDETLKGIIKGYVEAYEATDSEFEDNEEEEEKTPNFLTTFFTSVYEKFRSLFL